MDLVVQNTLNVLELVVSEEGNQLELIVEQLPELVLEVNGLAPVISGAIAINVSAGTESNLLTNIVFSNSNNVSFGLNGSTITASFSNTGGGSGGGAAISAGASSQDSGTIIFSNSNNITFGLSNGIVTASFSNTGGAGGAAISAGLNSQNTGTIVFSNSNGLTFGLSNNGMLTASHNGITTTQTNYIFSNSNGVSFGTNGSTVTATVKTDYQSSGNYLTTAAQSNQVVNSFNGSTGQISFNVGSSLSSSTNGSSITIGLASNITTALQSTGNYLTTAMASDAGSRFVNTSAGLNLTNVSATFNSNSISISVAAGSNSSFSVQDSATTINPVARIAFSTGNNITLSLSTGASSVTVGVQHNLAGTSTGFTGGASISGSFTHNSSGLAISLSHPAWITTAAQSNQVVNSINGSTGIFSFNTGSSLSSSRNGNSITWGLASDITTALQPTGAYLTTAAQSNQVVNSINGSTGTFSFNTGSSLSSSRVGNAITWGLASNITTALQSAGAYLTTAAQTFSVQDSATTLTAVNRIAFSTGNNITLSLSTGASSVTVGVAHNLAGTSTGFGGNLISGSMTHNSSGLNLSLSHPAWLTTAALSGDTTKYIQNWKLTGNTAGTTSSAQGTDLWLAGGNNITISGSSNTISISAIASSLLSGGNFITISTNGSTISIIGASVAAAPLNFSAGTTSSDIGSVVFSNSNNVSFGLSGSTITAIAKAYTNSYFEPFNFQDATTSTQASLSQLNLQPFTIDNNLSFGNINVIGAAAIVPTSAAQTWSARLTNSTQGLSYQENHSITAGNLVDIFLFSRGAGNSSSELQTFASTRNSFLTFHHVTFRGAITATNTAGGSVLGSQTYSVSVSYPFMTSGQSINGASSNTTWASGYTTWASTASNSSSFTMSTSAARTLSIASTYPATAGWSGAKLINLNFGTSLTPGEYWLGVIRFSTSSSSSSSASSVTGAAGTGNSYSVTFNASALTQTAELTWVGKTLTIANSFGSLGFVTTNNLMPQIGLGSFSGTWASNATFNNNAGNPNGAVAFTQLRSQTNLFQSWWQLASNRI